MFSSASMRSPMLLVKSCSRYAESSKLTMKLSSSGLLSRTNANAGLFTRSRLLRMLPLLSMTKPRLSGMSSCLNVLIVCWTLSSNTRKFSCFRPSTGRPSLSRTEIGNCTSSVSTLRVYGLSLPVPCFCGCGRSCARRANENRRREKMQNDLRTMSFDCTRWASEGRSQTAQLILACSSLGCWRVVSLFGAYVEALNTFRRIHFHSKLSPLAVFSSIGRMIPEHVLVFQFDSDLGADVFEFVHRIRKHRLASGQLRQFFDERAAGTSRTKLGVKVVHNADAVNLHILFFYELFHVLERVAAAIVLAVGDQQECFLGIATFF